jgi:hypothetical protein
MALIKCTECQTEISDKAKTCLKCGCPISNSMKDDSTVLQEQTSKKLKIQQVYAACIMIAGIFLSIWLDYIKLGGLLAFCGLVWLSIINIQIWWKHK